MLITYKTLLSTGLLLFYVQVCGGWRAVPANTAMYAMQASRFGHATPEEHERAPRTYLHSVYKFGYCAHNIINKVYLRKTSNMTIKTWRDARFAHYVYLLEKKHTQKFATDCIVMKIYVPMQYVFARGRIPVYYCQGHAYVLMFNTAQRVEIHEFYFHIFLGLLAHFEFEFYHPIK